MVNKYKKNFFWAWIFSSIILYRKEQKLIKNNKLLKDIYEKICKNKYSIIVAHSMGAKLIYNVIEKYWLPPNLKKIITIQSDLERSYFITNKKVIKQINTKKFERINYYNPIDFHLMIGTLLNLKLKNWLFWSKDPNMKNIFYKIKFCFDKHNCNINNYSFIKKITEI